VPLHRFFSVPLHHFLAPLRHCSVPVRPKFLRLFFPAPDWRDLSVFFDSSIKSSAVGSPFPSALALLFDCRAYAWPPFPPPSPYVPTWFPSAPVQSGASGRAPVLNLDEQGKPLTFRSALAGRFGDQWRQGNGDELLKLVETSRALTPVHHTTSPPTYLNNVVKEKWSPASLLRPRHMRDITSDVDRRVRGTAGGDRLSVDIAVSQTVASYPTLNCLLNSVVSDHAFFGSVDITDYYLGTPNPNPPFIKVFTDQYPPEVLLRLRLSPFTKVERRTGRLCALPSRQNHLRP
jgi:hypothetical protein